MNKHDIIAQVGSENYLQACVQARNAAPYTGQKEAPITFDSDLPHELNDLIWYADSSLPDTEQIELLFALYSDMPCYALLMEVPMHFDHQLSQQAKIAFWQHVRRLLTHNDDALAEPVAYLLWCDFFEFDDRCNEAWNEVINKTDHAPAIKRILRVAGPVPFHLKEPLYMRLVQDRAWHGDILQSLQASATDIYGQIDTKKALEILKNLNVPSMAADLERFRHVLLSSQSSA